MKKNTEKYPQCHKCGQAMVWTFAFAFNEWACLPCNTKAPMFNGLEKVKRNVYYMNRKRKLWEEELHKIAITKGGASCLKKEKGESCGVCDNKDFKFKIWKANL